MRFTLLVTAVATFASAALAQCMSENDAVRVVENFVTLITDYSNATALQVLYEDFTEYSDSLNELVNNGCPFGPRPIGSPTFSSRDAFMAGQGGQPSMLFEALNIWHNCDTVTMRWRGLLPGMMEPEQIVTGIAVFDTAYVGGVEPWLVDTMYSEFNNAAWLYSWGIITPSCDMTASRESQSRRDGTIMLL